MPDCIASVRCTLLFDWGGFRKTRCRMFCNQTGGQFRVLMWDSGFLRKFRIRRGVEVQNLANLLLDIVSLMQIKFGIKGYLKIVERNEVWGLVISCWQANFGSQREHLSLEKSSQGQKVVLVRWICRSVVPTSSTNCSVKDDRQYRERLVANNALD